MENIYSKLNKYNQTHLLNFIEGLNENERQLLLKDILKIDFELMEKLYNKACMSQNKELYTISALDKVYVKDNIDSSIIEKWKELGEKDIQNGKLAVVTMAGGQGTRLGHNGPKGTYMLDTKEGTKSIFEILIDKLKEATIKYGIYIQWYIMTSEENNDETVKFFEDNNYFNYGKENITFFKQGVLPMKDLSGKIILENKHKVKLASDGNGGIFKALGNQVLKMMKDKGIQWVYVSGVDNILVNFVDEVFLGGLIDSKLHIACKSVLKENPNEKVGIICKKNNKPFVVEYTEIPEEMVILRKDNGELSLCEANIVSNIYSVELLEKLVDVPLPYHVAKKKCDILDNEGIKQQSIEPNAYKFEAFIFDSYTYVDDIFVMRVKREEEFAPIKNKEGEDSPSTAVKLFNNMRK